MSCDFDTKQHAAFTAETDGIHGPFTYIVEDSVARNAIAVTAEDASEGRLVLQTNDKSIWKILTTTPTFERVLTSSALLEGSNVTITTNVDGSVTIASSGVGGGVSDHGALTGLTDLDHPSTAISHTATGWTSGASAGAQINEIVANGPKNKLDATVPPTVSNDNTEGYSPGSMWVDLTNAAAWWLEDASTGAANWVAFRKANVHPTLAPGINDDASAGYSVGDFWYEQDQGRIWLCYRNDTGNAGWANVWPDVDSYISTITTNTEANLVIASNNIDFAIPSYASDAAAEAAGVGDNTDGPIEFYWNTVTRQIRYGWHYASGGGITDPENPSPSPGVQWGGLTYPRGKAGSSPGTGDDVGDGWEEGALWQNTLSGALYHLRDNTAAAAVWGQLLELISGSLEERLKFANDGAFQFPTVAASSPTTGDTRENSGYLERYDGTTWQKVAALVNNWAATAAPTVNDDANDGYVVGSKWGDVTNDNTYECTDATVGAANWEQTNAVKRRTWIQCPIGLTLNSDDWSRPANSTPLHGDDYWSQGGLASSNLTALPAINNGIVGWPVPFAGKITSVQIQGELGASNTPELAFCLLVNNQTKDGVAGAGSYPADATPAVGITTLAAALSNTVSFRQWSSEDSDFTIAAGTDSDVTRLCTLFPAFAIDYTATESVSGELIVMIEITEQ